MNKRELTRKEFKTSSVDENTNKSLNIFDTPSVKVELLKYGIHNDRTEKDTYIIGDLNGSAIKLLQFLVSTGILKGTSSNRLIYDKFEQWYRAHSETWLSLDAEIWESNGVRGVDSWIKYKEVISKELKAVITLLSGFTLDRERCNAVRLVFVGDTLADRGVSDTATLKIYDLLQKHGIDYTVVLSNHDITVVQKYVLGGWRTQIHEEFDPAIIPEKGSYDCGTPSLYDQTKKMFLESYLPKLDLVYLEGLRNDNDFVQCAVSHAPIISKNLFSLEKILRERFYPILPAESKFQISTIDVTNPAVPLIDRLKAGCFNLQMMFRSLRDAYMSGDNTKGFKDFLASYDETGDFEEFVANRSEPTKIHDDFLNVYGHSSHAKADFQIKDEHGNLIKKGIRFAPKREDRSEIDLKTMQPIVAMVDVQQTKNNANNICLDNLSGRAGNEQYPLLTARISTTDAKFTPKKKASTEIQSALNARNDSIFSRTKVTDKLQNPHIESFEFEMARSSILEGIENYIGETDRLRRKWTTRDGHGEDGRRRAIALKALIDSAKNLDDLYEALSKLVNGRINRDAAGSIGGSIRLRPASLTTTIITAISKVPCFMIDFGITENRDANRLTAIKSLMGQPRTVNNKKYATR